MRLPFRRRLFFGLIALRTVPLAAGVAWRSTKRTGRTGGCGNCRGLVTI